MAGRRRSGGEWMGNGRLWVVRRPLREDARRPGGLGATGKRMGRAAECCARREGGAIRRHWATHQEGATPGSPWLPLLERAAPDGSTRGDDEAQEQSPANIASWRLATNEAFRGCARPAGQRSRATRRSQAFGPARATRRLGRTRRAALIQRGPEGGVWDSPGRDGSTTPPHRSGSGSRRRRWTATTARGVAATASRAGWRARVRRVRRESGMGPPLRYAHDPEA